LTGEFKTEKQSTHKLSRQKVALARLFTDSGYDILLSDVDVVWMRDPQPYFAQYLPPPWSLKYHYYQQI